MSSRTKPAFWATCPKTMWAAVVQHGSHRSPWVLPGTIESTRKEVAALMARRFPEGMPEQLTIRRVTVSILVPIAVDGA